LEESGPNVRGAAVREGSTKWSPPAGSGGVYVVLGRWPS